MIPQGMERWRDPLMLVNVTDIRNATMSMNLNLKN